MPTTATPPSTRHYEGLTVPDAGAFEIDPVHTRVDFLVRHLMVSKVRGNFGQFAGTITVGEDPLASSIEVEIQAGSVTTGDDQRDGHLRSPDFLDVEQYPTISFHSGRLTRSDGEHFLLDGELTIHGVTKTVPLVVEYSGVTQDPWGNQRIGFSASAEVNREDFGLTWNQALETGGVVVGKSAKIEIEAEAIRQS